MPFLDLTKLQEQKITEVRHPETNQLVMVIHTKGGVVHREDNLPAAIHYDAEGNPWAHEWYVDGKSHRDDGPSRMYVNHPQPTEHFPTGEKIVEMWNRGEFQGCFQMEHELFHSLFQKGK